MGGASSTNRGEEEFIQRFGFGEAYCFCVQDRRVSNQPLFLLLASLTLPSGRWMRHVPFECWLTSTRLHGVESQNPVLFIVTALRTSYTR
jgi:hypothetical protein